MRDTDNEEMRSEGGKRKRAIRPTETTKGKRSKRRKEIVQINFQKGLKEARRHGVPGPSRTSCPKIDLLSVSFI